MRKHARGTLSRAARPLTAAAAVLVCAVAPAPAIAKTAPLKPASPRLLKADMALQAAIPGPTFWPQGFPGNDFSNDAIQGGQDLTLIYKNWDGMRRLAENVYGLAGEAANGKHVDSVTAQAYGGYSTLATLYGPTLVHACTTKSLALTCLRRSVDKMHAFEQEIATESSQVMGLIEDDIGAGEPGVVADMAGATTQILNQVASDINALQATVPAG